MIKMKSLLLLLILALTAACADQKTTQTTAPVADNEENRLAAAKEYLKVLPPQEMLAEMSTKVVKMLPEKQHKVFLGVMSSKSLEEATYRISLKALAKHFTVNELKAMTTFYGSPDGKSSWRKLSSYMGDIMPQINQEVVTSLKKVEQEEQAKSPQEPKAQPEPKKLAPQELKPPAKPKAPEPKPQEPKAQPAPKETK